ncbi:hypothetical protein [Bifidobacterium simiarum]|uniref:hypothetical protein n=1 Tax=Bifidobacterium simiarum TaxID=2045441 RepID=UPI001BDD49B6|nr:hypothetical protein [Bifidobacterium simiarum]MBT1166794.1 hypothetical protein [Bifidobacterium simiarum]
MRGDLKLRGMPADRRRAVIRTNVLVAANVVCCALLGWSHADHDSTDLFAVVAVLLLMASNLASATVVGTTHRYFTVRPVKGVRPDQAAGTGERERRWRERRMAGGLLCASNLIAYVAARLLTVHGFNVISVPITVGVVYLLVINVRAVVRMLLIPMLDPNQNKEGKGAGISNDHDLPGKREGKGE